MIILMQKQTQLSLVQSDLDLLYFHCECLKLELFCVLQYLNCDGYCCCSPVKTNSWAVCVVVVAGEVAVNGAMDPISSGCYSPGMGRGRGKGQGPRGERVEGGSRGRGRGGVNGAIECAHASEALGERDETWWLG